MTGLVTKWSMHFHLSLVWQILEGAETIGNILFDFFKHTVTICSEWMIRFHWARSPVNSAIAETIWLSLIHSTVALSEWKWGTVLAPATDDTDLMLISPTVIVTLWLITFFLFSHGAWASEQLKTYVLLLFIRGNLWEIRWKAQPRLILIGRVDPTSTCGRELPIAIDLLGTELVRELTFERVLSVATFSMSRSYDTVGAVGRCSTFCIFLISRPMVRVRVHIRNISMQCNIERCLGIILLGWFGMVRLGWYS